MTKEEAISILNVLASFQGVMEYLEQHSVSVQDACNMAIQALSQEPCDDTISRDAVLDALLDYWHDIQFVDGSGYDVYEDCKAVIDDLPPVTQKSGKWKREEFPNFTVAWFCNKCGRGSYRKSNFCPNCGAKMVEPQESEDKE